MPEQKRIAVIGAGAVGLMAIKELKDGGFDVTAFEARPYLGGLWKDTDDSTISVHETTIFNTSKFRAAISDFPFSEDTDVFPTALQLYEYLQQYADHFDIRRHVQLGCRAHQILRENDTWKVGIEDVTTGKVETHTFDRVCVATGSFYKPRWPVLNGLEKFKGRVLHSIDFHGSEPFKDQNVLLIGMHATAQDVTASLSQSAKRVYLSHRHGLTLLPRYNTSGQAFDTALKLPFLMFQSWIEKNLPGIWIWLLDMLTKSISKSSFPNVPESWGLRPMPSIATSTPLIADTLFPFLESGFAEPVPAVKEIIGPNTVVLTNNRMLEDIDVIIYCTGYHMMLPDNLIPKPSDASSPNDYDPYPQGPGYNPRLYWNIFPLSVDPKIRNTLAILGQCGTLYPGWIFLELQAMAVNQIWTGNKSLPAYEEMINWHEKHSRDRIAYMKKYNTSSDPKDIHTFYPVLVPLCEYFPWVNHVAGTGLYEHFGGKFGGLFNYKTWKLWWNDQELYHLCTKGILSPTIFRIFETGGRKALGGERAKAMLRKDNAIFQRAVEAKLAERGLYDEEGKKKTA